MAMPLPNVPDTEQIAKGAQRFREDRAQINRVWISPPGSPVVEPPHVVGRVWIRPAPG